MSATYTHQGLPDGVKPFDLPDMLEKLRMRLGLRDEDITYIRYLLRKDCGGFGQVLIRLPEGALNPQHPTAHCLGRQRGRDLGIWVAAHVGV